MKRLVSFLFLLLLCLLAYNYRYEISYYYTTFNFKEKNTIYETNNYKVTNEYKFVKENNSNTINSKEELIDLIYTILNNGYEEYNLKCNINYRTCLQDVEIMLDNQDLLSNINNFVHPYNSFEQIIATTNGIANVNFKIIKTYTSEEIKLIDQKVDELYGSLVNPKDSYYNKIKTIHDYLVQNASYDTLRADTNNSMYSSNKAYGPLFEGKAICSGYSDAMSLFLIKMGLENYKIASEKHIWNLVKIDNNWYHIDLTWDDPVSQDGKNYYRTDYLLINTNKLYSLDKTEHTFDTNIYQEAQ